MKAAMFADRTLFATLGIWRSSDTRFAWTHEGAGPHTWHEDALWDEQDGYPWKVTLLGDDAMIPFILLAPLCSLPLDR